MQIVISSGHGKYIRGASGYLDEVDEARLVVEQVATYLAAGGGVIVTTYHDDISTSQNENLNRIVDFHNSQGRHDLDVSVHFNAYETTDKPMGTECLYVSQDDLAEEVAASISSAAGLIDRGPKKRTDLFFLNNTEAPAILIEVCFVDSRADADLYRAKFHEICAAIAGALIGEDIEPAPPEEPAGPAPGDRPLLEEGDWGPHVGRVQTILGIDADGQFGPITEDAVQGLQSACGLDPDGIVGDETWHELDELELRKASGGKRLPAELIGQVEAAAEASAIARYSWNDRGVMPKGYIAGVALSYALALLWLDERNSAARAMAQADRNDADTDALSWYGNEFAELNMDNGRSGRATLRHLFVLIMGLGPRESSGRYCEGRDLSADNVTADTAEAGLFQTSWNIRGASAEIEPLLGDFWENPNGFLDTWRYGVEIKGDELGNYGSGDGAKYQFLSKYAPAFHVFVTAIGLRYLRQHWGPINRSEVELIPEADELLRQVQTIVDESGAVA